MRLLRYLAILLVLSPTGAAGEVTRVTITSTTPLAGGRPFGTTGSYELLQGRIEFALDPEDPHNRRITDLAFAPRDADGRVHFSSDLAVLRPADPSRGNGVLLFEVANRGNKALAGIFNRGTGDSTTPAGVGDGFLMREGYTIVWVGWQFDLPGDRLRIDAPAVTFPPNEQVPPVAVDIIVNQATNETVIKDEALRPPVVYPPVDVANPRDTLTVRDRFWDQGQPIPRASWRFVPGADGAPRVHLDSGFEPGRWYRVTYQGTSPVVAGVGLAAMRDAASAFRYRTDLPVHGRLTYAYGNSQTGRFLRQFLYDGFNADQSDRRAFDAIWVHIAGAARSNANQRFATLSQGDMFEPTRFPFTDAEERDTDGTRDGLQTRYPPDQRPKVFYTNTPVEYWGGGRAAALVHTSVDGRRDLVLPDNVRVYFLASTQHLPYPFPPDRTRPSGGGPNINDGQALANPVPQSDIMRALLRALHQWASAGVMPPPSAYPRLSDGTLVPVTEVGFPTLAGVSDPRQISGPARIINGTVTPLPFLVPQVDADGNDIAGIRDPWVAVPLATTTGWNFRHPRVGNPGDIYQILGSFVPFAPTRAARLAAADPRPSIEERYKSGDDYLQRIRVATSALVDKRFLLAEDLESIVERANAYWQFSTATPRAGLR